MINWNPLLSNNVILKSKDFRVGSKLIEHLTLTILPKPSRKQTLSFTWFAQAHKARARQKWNSRF